MTKDEIDAVLGGAEVVFQTEYDDLLSVIAKLVVDAEGRILLEACRWMHKRGHKSAATDLDYNWNDTDQPGDGSCQALHIRFPLPKPPEQP